MRKIYLLAWFAFFAPSGFALAEPNQPVRAIETPAPQYPEQAYTEGHQGKVLVKLRILEDGIVESAEIKESSKSQLLDAAALEAVKKWKFSPATNPEGKAIPVGVVAPVEFAKDSYTSVLKKQCSDFNADVKYFRTTFSEKPLSDMRIYKLTLGMLFTAEKTMERKLAVSKAFPAAFTSTVSKCETTPDEIYGNVLAALLKN